ncbi:MAG TPA: HD domain-containing protein, partial [Candidatus Saccharimonas sp.]|nr:HD domain-containing protein [Candidatus Saccharimonas sp.]
GLASPVRAADGQLPLPAGSTFEVMLRVGLGDSRLSARGWFVDTDAAERPVQALAQHLASAAWTELFDFRPTFELVAKWTYDRLASDLPQLQYVELENRTIGVTTRYDGPEPASLDNLLDFVSFTHAIRQVKRATWVKDEETFENDAEHSFQLAMVALYLIERNRLPLAPYKAMGLALVHDILEVHAGDTPAYGAGSDTQAEREAAAVRQLRAQWPDQRLMLSLIDEYESATSAEARFVYALDKLIPMLNNLLDRGRNWQREHITLEQIIQAKSHKVSADPDIQRYFELTVELLRQRPELFG